ncbi:MAG: oligoribonuclease [Sandaracinaceae bacterium]|nr:oligoribonuclease [Sandaracinaceae bacterium]
MSDKREGGHLVWIDLEMSGLDPDRERILEIAVVVTDDELQIVGEALSLVLHQDEAILSAMDEWNRKHHGASGLIDEVQASSISEQEAEARVIAHLKGLGVEAQSAPLAGNSAHHDRRFLARHMPSLHAYLHYRIVDVSTVKELVRRWLPEVYDLRPPKRATHRALNDIMESIEELRYYRDHAFRRPVRSDEGAR